MSPAIIDNLPGTWLLESIKLINSSGNAKNMYGEKPIGMVMFDANGYMNAQLGSSSRTLFASDVLDEGTADEIKQAYNNYMAFYGQYKEPAPGTLSIALMGCTFPNWQGKEIIRYAEIENDLLLLSTPPTPVGPEYYTVRATWRKV